MAVVVITAVVITGHSPPLARASHSDDAAGTTIPLAGPPDVSRPSANSATAFREEDAGICAHYRIPQAGNGTSEPSLDINSILNALETEPPESAIRGAGTTLDLGLNFAIVELPMYAAVVSPAPTETVTVYYDDQGWIVAYLDRDRPAAALWKHRSADGKAQSQSTADEDLKRNLLVLAINEVLRAHDAGASEVSHDEIGYFDWRNPELDAFVLFSVVTDGGESDPVRFVVPHTIDAVNASAAVLITNHTDTGSTATASIKVDGAIVADASGDRRLASAEFALNRNAGETSLHRVVVDTGDQDSAAGVVMLLYDKP